MKEFDADLWATCMLEQSKASPDLYPDDFGSAAAAILHHLFGSSPEGITHSNCRKIYLSLVHWIHSLINNGITVCLSLNNTSYDSDCDDTDCDNSE